MKQEITTDDLQLLNSKGLEKYYEYLKKMDYYCSGARDYGYSGAVFYYLNKMHGLSIGELIEFLDQNVGDELFLGHWNDGSEWIVNFRSYEPKNYKVLCDALWAAAVEILNKE